jgi:NagD protein
MLQCAGNSIKSWLIDMDGVLVREEHPIPGADLFLRRLRERGTSFLVLTNNSTYTPRDLAARLRRNSLEVPEEAIWTSALATANLLHSQRPGGSAYVIGEAGLTTALHEVGYTLTERDPDYLVLGETRTYSFVRITTAIRLVAGGARFIATMLATGVAPYFVGKPNPLMMRYALNAMGAHSETTAIIGDRMDTDVVAGLEAGMYTVLVLTGTTTPDQIDRFPYRPSRVVDSIADLLTELEDEADSRLAASVPGRCALSPPANEEVDGE